MVAPLDGLRVVDLSTWIAGAYCTKLLADGGAEVVKVEGPGGALLRRWSASGATIAEGDDGALFNFLAASTCSLVVDESDAALGALHALLASADVVVWSRDSILNPDALAAAHPHLIVTAITPFGLTTSWADAPATEFTVQAWSGGVIGLGRGSPEREPVHVGGQIGEWLTGVTAAVATLAALRRSAQSDDGDLVDVAMLEVCASTMTYAPVTYHDQLGREMRKRRFVPTPGVAAANDGLVGLGVGTGQQWLDFCVLTGHPEWQENPRFFLDRASLAPTIDAWIGERSAAEVLESATAFRIPNAPIVNGANATSIDHFVARDTFRTNPRDGAPNPRPPVRLSAAELREPAPSPRLGEHNGEWSGERFQPRTAPTSASVSSGPLPFSGLRVLDMTAYWAGPFAGHLLAQLGAEVIHLESPTRPDGVRFVGGIPQTEERYWEKGPIFTALNVDKKSLTIDFSDPRGVDLLRRFVATCDVVIENYTPRVLDNAGLGYESLREVRDDLIMVRMPGFGLDGPWRDNAAFAFVIEDASGLTWMTGPTDTLPIEPYCVGDPNAGLHAVYGLQLALAHRDRTGEGCLVEAAMIDAAINIAAEQFVEHGAYGTLLGRDGNRGPMAAPQNLYRTAGVDEHGRDDNWVAIAVATDAQWNALRGAMGEPDWSARAEFATAIGRRAAHDEIDEHLATWCRERTAEEVVEALWPAGVPVANVMQPHHQPQLAVFGERGYFAAVDHPLTGRARCAGLPFTMRSVDPQRSHSPAPLLGAHTATLLAEIGVTPDEYTQLETDRIVGNSMPQPT